MPEMCYFPNRFILPFFTFEPVNSIKCFYIQNNFFFWQWEIDLKYVNLKYAICVPVYFTGSVLNRLNKKLIFLYSQRFFEFPWGNQLCDLFCGDGRLATYSKYIILSNGLIKRFSFEPVKSNNCFCLYPHCFYLSAQEETHEAIWFLVMRNWLHLKFGI